MDYKYTAIGLLILLSLIPVWLVPVAPLSDWPTHLAISSEMHYLLAGHTSSFYHLDFTFLGYSSVHFALTLLQDIFSMEQAGQIILSLYILLNAACWWYFFRTLAPDRPYLFLFGLLMPFSTFFYSGNLNFLFAVAFGLVMLADGLSAIEGKRYSLPLFILSALLVYLSHGLVFFMLAGLLGLYAAGWHAGLGRKSDLLPTAILVVLSAFFLFNTISNPLLLRDYAYYSKVNICSADAIAPRQVSYSLPDRQFTQFFGKFMLRLGTPLFFLYSVFGAQLLAILCILLALGLLLWTSTQFMEQRQSILHSANVIFGPIQGAVDYRYLFCAIYFLAIFYLVPSCLSFVCQLNERGTPFFLAFALLAFGIQKPRIAFFWPLLLIIFVNVLFQASLFSNEAGVQQSTFANLRGMAGGLSAGQSVFIIPNRLSTSYSTWAQPPYPNLNYPALLVHYAPGIYVSGLYTSHDFYLLRSNMTTFDEFVHFGPNPYLFEKQTPTNKEQTPIDIWDCYSPPPPGYTWILGQNLTLTMNSRGS